MAGLPHTVIYSTKKTRYILLSILKLFEKFRDAIFMAKIYVKYLCNVNDDFISKVDTKNKL